jgi:carboxyl-terminal processing protease
MKKFITKLIIGIILLAGSNQIFAVHNSTNLTISQLKKTAQIWGFLKYYHPTVGNGSYNWDQQLLTVLNQLDSSFSDKETDVILYDWINSLGEFPRCLTCSETSKWQEFNENFDLSWFQQFDITLQNSLEEIRKNRFQGDHNYFFQSEENFVIEFRNEPNYDSELWKLPELRLLTLFRYWNYVEYFYPYKHTLDFIWSSKLEELIPKFLNVQTETEFHLLLLQTVSLLEDSHAYFKSDLITRHFGKKSPPFRIKFITKTAVISEIYNDSLGMIDDIRIGDIITEINDVSISLLLKDKLQFIPGSNEASKLRDIKPFLFNGSTDSIKIAGTRGNQEFSKVIKRYDLSKIKKNSHENVSWKFIKGNIGYVNMGLLTPDMVDSMMDAFTDTDGIIFDLRNYPNNTFNPLCQNINNNEVPFAKVVIADASYPGKFIWLPFYMNCGSPNARSYEKKIVVLVNEDTQSQAEFTAMALSTAKKTIVIGSQTAGADGNASKFRLPGGFDTMFTGLGIYYPDESQTQRVGIKIDIVIKPTIEGIRSGKDEVLEYAIKAILK